MQSPSRNFLVSRMSTALILTCILACLPLLTQGQCPEGRFGGDCRHTCHCAPYSRCDDITGSCGYNGTTSSCAPGFSGPNCQTRNAAYGAKLLIANTELQVNLMNDPNAMTCPFIITGYRGPFRVSLTDPVPIRDIRMTFRTRRFLEGENPDPSMFRFVVGGRPCVERVVRDGDAIAASMRMSPSPITVAASCGGRVSDEIAIEMKSTSYQFKLCDFSVPICSEGFYGAECEHECEKGSRCDKTLETDHDSANCGPTGADPCDGSGGQEATTTLEDCKARCTGDVARDPDCCSPLKDARTLGGGKTSPGLHWPSAGVGAGITIAVLVVVALIAAAVAVREIRRRRSRSSHASSTSSPLQTDDGYEVPAGFYQSSGQGSYASLNPFTRDQTMNIYQEVGNNDGK